MTIRETLFKHIFHLQISYLLNIHFYITNQLYSHLILIKNKDSLNNMQVDRVKYLKKLLQIQFHHNNINMELH